MKHLSILLVMAILLAALTLTGPVASLLTSAPAQAPTNPNRISSDVQSFDGFYVDGPTQMQATLGIQKKTVSPEIFFDGPTHMQAAFGK